MISSAAEAKENVDQLIYLSAILLEPGESMQLDGSKIQIDVDANLISEVKKSSAIPAFYGDVDPKLAKPQQNFCALSLLCQGLKE